MPAGPDSTRPSRRPGARSGRTAARPGKGAGAHAAGRSYCGSELFRRPGRGRGTSRVTNSARNRAPPSNGTSPVTHGPGAAGAPRSYRDRLPSCSNGHWAVADRRCIDGQPGPTGRPMRLGGPGRPSDRAKDATRATGRPMRPGGPGRPMRPGGPGRRAGAGAGSVEHHMLRTRPGTGLQPRTTHHVLRTGLEWQPRPAPTEIVTRHVPNRHVGCPGCQAGVRGALILRRPTVEKTYSMVRAPIIPSSRCALPVAGSGMKQMNA